MTVCLHCNREFPVSDSDREFYRKVSPLFGSETVPIPEPRLCPSCRFQRRLTYRNEYVYYKRKCDNCSKSIVSVHSTDKPYPVYCHRCWWGESWSPLAYGRAFDFSRGFFEQFQELQSTVPQPAMMNDNGVSSENCEYCQDFAYGKNCYLVTASWQEQDCMYCTQCNHVRDVVDSVSVSVESELVYECVHSHKLYQCSFLQDSSSCRDCAFGLDLRGCSDCFCCVGLRQKRYCIWNREYSPAEYKKLRAEYDLGSREGVARVLKEFAEFSLRFPRRAVSQTQCDACSGDHLFQSKASWAFDVINAEDSKWFFRGDHPIHTYDVNNSGNPQWCLEGVTPDDSYMTHFTTWCWRDKESLYSDNCHSSENLFGCISLRRQKFCILNTQYSKSEYEVLAATIAKHMVTTGEWGEFFPMSRSPFAYNETVASDLFAVDEGAIQRLGLRLKEREPKRARQSADAVPPNHIDDVADDIVTKPIHCQTCEHEFRVIAAELQFYRRMRLPVPASCPDCRRRRRLTDNRSKYELFERECAQCKKAIETSYLPNAPETVVCEECFLSATYS